MKLTPCMRAALEQARRDPLRRTFDDRPGKPPWPASPPTLHALVRHQLLDRTESRNRRAQIVWVWRITEAGHTALQPKVRVYRDRDVYLAAPGSGRDYVGIPAIDGKDNSGDYTTNPTRSCDYDPDMGYLPVMRADPAWARNGRRPNLNGTVQRLKAA